MNPNSFSILGYLSVLLWLAVPFIWLLARRFRLPGWLALALAAVSLILAKVNSSTHVERIEVQQNEEAVNQLDVAAAKRKAVEDARAGEVADIRFAEDGDEDFIDKAGMEDADKKYLDSIEESSEPSWKGKKKKRGESESEGGDLEDEIGGKEAISGVESDSLPTEEERTPIYMSAEEVSIAQRLDSWNIDAARFAILLGLLIFALDYLARANSYAYSYFPLPFPASWRNAFTRVPASMHCPNPPRRTVAEELAWLVRRGDVFICFAKDAGQIPEALPRLGKFGKPIDVIHVEDERISDEFIFEAVWFGRSCFVVDSIDRINRLYRFIQLQLEQRYVARARSKFNVHLVWSIAQTPQAHEIAAFESLASPAGFTLFIQPS